ncbi:hypothetical protein GCM10023094_09700 [Rhodococcus olei]|uniref:Uncharacterized protein n=1 Tax=Rhodococcus olei TaxID=2161675 RepID=A0ABP8NY19_9NOCA
MEHHSLHRWGRSTVDAADIARRRRDPLILVVAEPAVASAASSVDTPTRRSYVTFPGCVDRPRTTDVIIRPDRSPHEVEEARSEIV